MSGEIEQNHVEIQSELPVFQQKFAICVPRQQVRRV